MNDKFKALAEQANLHDGWFCGQGNIQKFAELLVHECSELCYNSTLKDSDAHAMAILDHFDIDGAKSWK